MSFLPIVQREMRVAVRRKWTYRTRALFALTGIVVCVAIYFAGSSQPKVRGEMMIVSLGIVAMVFAVFSGCFLTADTVSSEKRDGTLGLLFLTDLRGYDIVLGKMAANMLTAWFGLMALFPVFFLPILTGGVTWGECLRILLSVTVSFFLSLSLGLLISIFTVEAKKAVLATFFLLLLLIILPIAYIFVMEEIFGMRTTPYGLPQASPAFLLMFSFDQMYQSKWQSAYMGSIGFISLLGLLCFIAACVYLPLFWRKLEAGPVKPLPSKPRRMARWFSRSFRTRPCFTEGEEPYETLLKSWVKIPWFAKAFFRCCALLACGCMIYSLSTNRGGDDAFAAACFTVLGLHIITKFILILEVTRPLQEDRRSGALELLLSTPVREARLLAGHIAAFKRLFRRSFWTLVVFNLLLFVIALVDRDIGLKGDEFVAFTSMIFCSLAWLVSDFRTIHWIGMRQALLATTPLKAAFITLLKVIVLPWIPFWLGIAVLAATRARDESITALILIWSGLGILFHFFLRQKTKWVLSRKLRSLASGME